MYSRMQKPPGGRKSFFLLGPRGTGKTWWLKKTFPDAIFIDLLHAVTRTQLAARPERLEQLIPDGYDGWVVIDEVQKVPDLLNEVHRLIEHKGYRFVLTGSSARTLRRKGVNLLAGRALLYHMHPLTAGELGEDFDLQRSLAWGHLPAVQHAPRACHQLEASRSHIALLFDYSSPARPYSSGVCAIAGE